MNIIFYLLPMKFKAGLGRSGKLFATDWDNVKPDVYIFRKSAWWRRTTYL